MGIIANTKGDYLPANQWLCGVVDIFYMGSNYISVWFVALISLERGLLVIHKITLPPWFWKSIMCIEFFGFLIFNFISIFLNEMSLADLGIYCMSTPDFITGYITLIFYFIMMCSGLLATVYSYMGIAIVQRKRAWKDIRELNIDKDEALKQANKVIRKVLMLLGLYLACNLTEMINTILELLTGRTRTSEADFSSIVMLNFNPIVNCIILIQFHDRVKKELYEKYPYLSMIFGKFNEENLNNQGVEYNNSLR